MELVVIGDGRHAVIRGSCANWGWTRRDDEMT